MIDNKLTKDDCIALLKEKHAFICQNGENRYPKRSDFSEKEIVAIKAFLGPWPRALELAGLKPPRDDDAKAKRAEKKILAKRRRIAEIKNKNQDKPTDN